MRSSRGVNMCVVVMKWMTRAWHNGELSWDEEEALDAGYRSHLEAVLPRLPASVRVFAGEPDEAGYVSLHDGVVEWWARDGAKTLTLQIFCGDDLELGYRRLVVQYRGRVEIFGASERELADWLADAETQLLYDEIDVAGDGRFEHRFLLWPRGEFGVRFEDALVVSAAAAWETREVVWRRQILESSPTFARLLRAWETGHRRTRNVRSRLDNVQVIVQSWSAGRRRGRKRATQRAP